MTYPRFNQVPEKQSFKKVPHRADGKSMDGIHTAASQEILISKMHRAL